MRISVIFFGFNRSWFGAVSWVNTHKYSWVNKRSWDLSCINDLFSSFSESNNQRFVRGYFEIYQRRFDSFWSFCTGNNLICSDHFNHYHFHCKICPSCSRTCPWSVTKCKPVVVLKCIWFITLPTWGVKDFVWFKLWKLNEILVINKTVMLEPC